MPIISIIIPVYNTQKYLKRCLDSCLNQTLQEIEIIVINDASPDNSIEIMKKYEAEYPEKIKCIYLTENIRQGGARNIGLKNAKGEFALFVDSDDWIQPEMCEKLYLESLKSNADIVYCNVLREKKDGYVVNNRFPKELLGEVDEDKIRILIMQLLVGPWAHIIKTSIIIDNVLFFPERVIFEDMVITRMWDIYAHRISKVEEPYYIYCLNMDSVGQNKISVYYDDGFQCVNLLYKKLEEDSRTKKFKLERELICLYHAISILQNMIKRCTANFDDKIQKDFQKCINTICKSPYERIEWKYWFTKKEIKWIVSGIDFDYYRQSSFHDRVEEYREYYERLKMDIEIIFSCFFEQKVRKIAVWGKTDYALGFSYAFHNCSVIDRKEEAEEQQVECVLALRSLHCENIKNSLQGINVKIFDLQGYLLWNKDILTCLIS